MLKRKLLTGLSAAIISTFAAPMANAADCTLSSPLSADCTQDTDTTGAIELGDGTTVTLTIDGSISIDYTMNSDTVAIFGVIETSNGGNTITQNAAIGDTNPIDGIIVGETDTWIVNANITTNADSAVSAFSGAVDGDINLGSTSAGTLLQINNGVTINADINGNVGDNVEVGADGNGGEFTFVTSINNVNVELVSGTMTAQSRLGAVNAVNTLTVNEGTTLILDNGAFVTDLSNDGTITVASTNTLTVTGAYDDNGNSGTYNLNVSNSSSGLEGGRLVFQDTAAIDLSDDVINVIIEKGATVIGETTLTLTSFISTASSTAVVLPTTGVDSSYLYDISLVANGASYDLEITREDLTTLATTDNNLTLSYMLLDTLASATDGTIQDIQYNLANAASGDAYNEILETLQPSADASTYMTTNLLHNQARTMVQSRLHAIRNDRKIKTASKIIEERSYKDDLKALNTIEPAAGSLKNTGGYVVPNKTRALAMQRYRLLNGQDTVQNESALADQFGLNGDETDTYVVQNKTKQLAQKRLEYLKSRYQPADSDLSQQYRITALGEMAAQDKNHIYKDHHPQFWSEAFHSSGTQHDREGINGYKFDMDGFTLGYDLETDSRKTVYGAYLTYADTNIESGNANLTKSDLEHYLLGVYGSYRFDNDNFLNLVTSMSLNDIGHVRHNVGGTDLAANAQYDGVYTSIFTEYGKFIDYDNGLSISPSLGMNFSRMVFEDYRERGAGGANLIVQQDSIKRFDMGPNLTASMHRIFENGVSFIPEIYASYSYNLLGDRASSRAMLEGDNTSNGDGETTYRSFTTQNHFINIGAGMNFAANDWKIQSYYNFQKQDDFDAHIASLKLNYEL